MATINETLSTLMNQDGSMCVALVDANSGMLLGSAGSGVDMDLAAAGNTEVVRAKMKTMQSLGLKDAIDDILITLGRQYHILKPSTKKPGLFLYCVLDKSRANLALARRNVQDAEQALVV